MTEVSQPVRTCIGCRKRSAKRDLVRLVWQSPLVVVDSDQTRPGRGAYLHPDARCVEVAIRRQAAGRALRAGPVDREQLRVAVSAAVLGQRDLDG